ncbi:MAG: PQQ-dependent sugar dehydrogenase [Solirubrobacterales bacterium]
MHPLRLLGAVLLCLLVPAAARAATLQPIGNFERPIYLTSDPGNADRLFVVERPGRIKVVEGGTVSTFADLRPLVGCAGNGACTGKRGLLSIALAPDFDSSGRLYVDYAQNSTGEIHVAELVASGGSALSSTPRDVLVITHPGQSNHNGGQLQFGPEGDLFVATGDGGGSDDELHNAQDLEKLLGKILRIDPRQSGALPYTVPAGNPFPAATPPFDTIWSYGLRNPYRFSFDRLTGAIAIGDVGQAAREEVDYAPAPGLGGGANYGWNCREGLIAGPGTDSGCPGSPGDFVEPVFDYPHTNPGGAHGCAITGGYVVRDRGLGDLYGRYLHGDYCSGELRSLSLALPAASGDRSEGIVVNKLVSFGEDSCGRLYTVSELGEVARLVGAQPTPCGAAGPAPTAARPLAHSYAGIRALHRSVERGEKALITAWASPCAGRRGEPIKLFRGSRHIATRHLDRACTARFRPRISRRVGFRVTIAADKTYEAASSRRLGIRTQKRHHRHR